MKHSSDISELKKMQRASLLKMITITVIVVVFVVFSSVAWFTMNREVEGAGVQMTASDLPYEIKTIGDNIGFRSHIFTGEENNQTDIPISLMNIAGLSSKYKLGSFLNNGYHSSGSQAEIQWHLNVAQNDTDGMKPDSEGDISFFIVPKDDAPFTANFKLRIDGYTATQTKNADGTYHVTALNKIDSNSTASKQTAVTYLNSHILFFTGRTNVGTEQSPVYSYGGLLEDDELTVSFPNEQVQTVVKNQPIEIKLYWKWSNTFGQMVLDSGQNDSNLPVGVDAATRSELQSYVLANMMSIFHIVAEEQSDLLAGMTTSRNVNGETVYDFDVTTLKTGTNFEDISLKHNEADQEIGTNIDYMLLTLVAGQEEGVLNQ